MRIYKNDSYYFWQLFVVEDQILMILVLSHRIHVWDIYLHLPDKIDQM